MKKIAIEVNPDNEYYLLLGELFDSLNIRWRQGERFLDYKPKPSRDRFYISLDFDFNPLRIYFLTKEPQKGFKNSILISDQFFVSFIKNTNVKALNKNLIETLTKVLELSCVSSSID